MSSINRKLANLITSTGDVTSAALDNAASMQVFNSVDSLPTTGLSSGDQAFVESAGNAGTSRLYISNGSGWFNVALVNATPRLTLSSDGTIALSSDGTPTTITMTALDSDNASANLTLSLESGGDLFKFATVSRDSSVVTITARSEDSATTLGSDGSATLTFKATDGISIASVQNTFTVAFSVANSRYSTLLAKADTGGTDNQVDASTSTHAITETGPITSTAFSPYHPGGYSAYFDGNGDYLGIPDDNGFELDGDFTIECWFYRSAVVSGTYCSIIGGNGSSSNGWAIYITNSNGTISFFHSSFLLTYAENVASNTWYHVAVTRSGTSLKLFVNGAERHAVTNSTTFNQNDANTGTRIGYDIGANGYFNGYIRDVRVVKGTAVYTSAFTPPTSSLTAITNTSLLACHLPYIADGSTNSHTLTVAGNTQTRRFSPYNYLGYTKAEHGGSVYFDDAANTYMVTGPSNHADFGFGTGDWTVEMWIWVPSGYTQANNYIVDIGVNGLIFRIINNKFTYTNSTLGYSGDLISTGADFINNTWHHMAVCRISGTTKMYMNGKETASVADTHNSSSTKVWFGRYGGSVSYQYTGYVSDVRLVKGTGVYTDNFTPPTQPLTAITNTVLLTCTNKNSIWETVNGKQFTIVGTGPTVSDTQRKFTTSSALHFNSSSGNYLLKDLGETIGTRDFTVEAWVYPTSTGAQHVFQISNQTAGHQAITSQNTQIGIGLNNGKWRYGTTGGNAGYQHTTADVVTNTWHHVAYVRTGGYSKLYLNGTEIHSNADTANYSARYLAYGVGHQSNNMWSGYTQDLRISLDYARYTSNFTPPDSTFEG